MAKNEVGKQRLMIFITITESRKRWFVAVQSSELGYGSISNISQATDFSRTITTQGFKEIIVRNWQALIELDEKVEAGNYQYVFDNKLVKSLYEILSKTTAGDPMSSIRWTCKSVWKIAEQGHDVSNRTVLWLLVEIGDSLRFNSRSLSRENSPDRDK